ncbi:hypothetical protein MTsPCn9_10240 [Croceitalea sp. MTPC9]|uniref:tyrosine-type recombinase/integrase n=1 Tax=unclassified Croceitalea TaxID=2632280 RepID=UPI002B38A621|nr:hypothetical protein MTsPCn6_27000 [Croceitalea sp. MTPC6]GMN16088.1 hypothetical protein MTsPCn9_10240 [Croceitalea sp. MTPC9]
MARARLILDTRTESQSKVTGLFPIAIRIFHKKPRLIRLSHYTSIQGWNDKDKVLRKSVRENAHIDCDALNIEIYEKLDTAKKTIAQLGKSINNIPVDVIVKEVKNRWEAENDSEIKRKYEDCITLEEFGKVLIKRKLKAKKPSTAKWYRDSIDAFKDVNNGKDLKLSEITVKFLKDFETEHRSRGNTTNTISAYMRGASAIYNGAIKEDVFDPDKNTFSRYKIPSSRRVKKKALPKESVNGLKEVQYDHDSSLWHSKNYMIVMFLARGMNFIDLAKLKVKDIYSGYIFYGRSKTDDSLSVKIIPELQEILDYYLKDKGPDEFVFPVGNDGSPEMFKKYRSDRRLMNKNLKIIAKDARIDGKLTTYYLRHSWATIAKHMGISTSMISDALGHQSVSTTEGYLKSFTNDALDDANELVVT